MPLPADLRTAATELDRTVEALKVVGCDDEQLLAGNTAMAALIRQGAEEIEKQEQQMQFLCIENDSNRETVKAWKEMISEVRAILGCAEGERTQHAAERLVIDLAALRAEVEKHRELDRVAAGECAVEFPQPTEDGALLLKANRMMRYAIDALRARLAAAEKVVEEARDFLEDPWSKTKFEELIAAYDAAKGGQP